MGRGVEYRVVEENEADQRLDRWLRRFVPNLTQGRLERLCRRGELRLDGGRVKPATRLEAGQTVRVPPIDTDPAVVPTASAVTDGDAAMIRACVLYRDADVLAVNKPPGLAVQGGSGQYRHLDVLAEALRFDRDEKPRLVHRLDRDTSGVIILARHARAAAGLARAFRSREARKTYWAAVAGTPSPKSGVIRLGLVKAAGHGPTGEAEKMRTLPMEDVPETPGAKRATTAYTVIDAGGRRAAWVALSPITGRTHQLRAHMAAIGYPIIGDGKYGSDVPLEGRAPDLGSAVSRNLHLHARSIVFEHPITGARLSLTAPLPPHMVRTWDLMGWEAGAAADDPFEAFS